MKKVKDRTFFYHCMCRAGINIVYYFYADSHF